MSTRVQPGIESLVDDVLIRMDKNVQAVRNVRTLRDGESHGLIVGWNWLYGFLGERMRDYRAVLDQVSALVHLQPPDGVTRIHLQRFSPYVETPALCFSQRNRPGVYQYVYDLPLDQLRDLVYMFDTEPRGASADQAKELEMATHAWANGYLVSSLVRREIGDAILLRDRRFGWPHEDHLLTDPTGTVRVVGTRVRALTDRTGPPNWQMSNWTGTSTNWDGVSAACGSAGWYSWRPARSSHSRRPRSRHAQRHSCLC